MFNLAIRREGDDGKPKNVACSIFTPPIKGKSGESLWWKTLWGFTDVGLNNIDNRLKQVPGSGSENGGTADYLSGSLTSQVLPIYEVHFGNMVPAGSQRAMMIVTEMQTIPPKIDGTWIADASALKQQRMLPVAVMLRETVINSGRLSMSVDKGQSKSLLDRVQRLILAMQKANGLNPERPLYPVIPPEMEAKILETIKSENTSSSYAIREAMKDHYPLIVEASTGHPAWDYGRERQRDDHLVVVNSSGDLCMVEVLGYIATPNGPEAKIYIPKLNKTCYVDARAVLVE